MARTNSVNFELESANRVPYGCDSSGSRERVGNLLRAGITQCCDIELTGFVPFPVFCQVEMSDRLSPSQLLLFSEPSKADLP
jgi:hypothetical protein